LARGPSPKLGAVLLALEKRGELEKAAELKLRVLERFKGVASEAELLELPVDDLVGTLDLFNQLFLEVRKPRGLLERHVAALKSEGFTVVRGSKYA
jgi:hypothetical protein